MNSWNFWDSVFSQIMNWGEFISNFLQTPFLVRFQLLNLWLIKMFWGKEKDSLMNVSRPVNTKSQWMIISNWRNESMWKFERKSSRLTNKNNSVNLFGIFMRKTDSRLMFFCWIFLHKLIYEIILIKAIS